MSNTTKANVPAIVAREAPLRTRPSNYPEPFRTRMRKREKRPLGTLFELRNFGANLTRLMPGGESALLHQQQESGQVCRVSACSPSVFADGMYWLAQCH